MSDIALEAQGTVIQVGDFGSPEAYQTIPEVKSIAGPDGQASWMDTTDLASTAKEGRPGLKDEGQVRMQINYVPDNTVHTTLRNAFSNRTKKAIRIIFTDTAPTTKWDFPAYVTGFQVRAEVDGVLMADVTLRIADAIVEGT